MRVTSGYLSPLWEEKIIISVFAALYLALFSTEILTGDAMVYINQIRDNQVNWNPNHLLMSPTGHYWHQALSFFSENINAALSLKIFSGICAIVALLIFHSILVFLNVTSTETRLLGVVGLFFSQNFLSMAISEEFFIYQMPFLIAGLWFILSWYQSGKELETKTNDLYFAGIVLAIATGILANGVFLLALLGIGLALFERGQQKINFSAPFKLWSGAAVIGFSLFIGAYFYSSFEGSFVTWVTSYQGESNNTSQELYGLKFSMAGVLESLARIPFNTIANFVDAGGLGSVLKGLIFSDGLEYRPKYFQLALSALVMLMILALLGLILIWLLKNLKRSGFLKIMTLWILAIMAFNFLWNDSSDQFWMQILPVCWILILIYLGTTNAEFVAGLGNANVNVSRSRVVLAVLVLGIALINTLQFTYPNAYANIDEKSQQYRALLKTGDVEIMTGWDDLRWYSFEDENINTDRIVLMNAALGKDSRFKTVEDLKVYVENKLNEGSRVVVSRLFDLDNTPRPWDQLAKLGWSRSRLKQAFSSYNTKIIGNIDDVVIRELSKK